MRRLTTLLLLWAASAAAAQTTAPPPRPMPTPAAAGCAQRAYAQYAAAMAEWLRGSAARIGQARPEFIEAAGLHAQAESTELSRRTFRVKFLALNEPQRLQLDQGIAHVGEFDWTRQDEWRLRAAEPDYGDISDQADRARRAREQHPRLGRLERYLQDGYLESAPYLDSLAPLATQVGAADTALQVCLPLMAAPAPKPDRPTARIE